MARLQNLLSVGAVDFLNAGLQREKVVLVVKAKCISKRLETGSRFVEISACAGQALDAEDAA